MDLSLFDYDLPESFIAQTPLEPRDASKLMVIDRASGEITHRIFRDIQYELTSKDVLVINDTRVIPARVFAKKKDSGGQVELLLLQQVSDTDWLALVGGRGADVGRRLQLQNSDIEAEVIEERDTSQRLLRFSRSINESLPTLGQIPLPPYIHRHLEDSERYQTVYNRTPGSAAAPTAGLHFTPELLLRLREKGVQLVRCTLHVGLDTLSLIHI